MTHGHYGRDEEGLIAQFRYNDNRERRHKRMDESKVHQALLLHQLTVGIIAYHFVLVLKIENDMNNITKIEYKSVFF